MKIGLLYKDCLKKGGYPRDVRWLASSLTRLGHSVIIFCDPGYEKDGLIPIVRIKLTKELLLKINELDIIHVFSLFIIDHVLIIRKLVNQGIPIVVSNLGQLMKFCMQRHRIRKEFYLRLFTSYLKDVTFHVFSPLEEKHVQAYFPSNKTFIATLGLFPKSRSIPFKNKNSSSPIFLFFGRNDVFQKGIDILIDAFKYVINTKIIGINYQFIIAGNDWKNSRKVINKKLNNYNIQDKVKFLGNIDENIKDKLLNEASFLIFLSRFDGPPRPIRESIERGTPVIISPETNMGYLISNYNAGIVTELNITKIGDEIESHINNEEKYFNYCNGVERLRTYLFWDRVAEDYLTGYRDVLSNLQTIKKN